MRVIFSDRAYTALVAETLCKIKTETGGVFLGCYTNDTWYIVESLDPGPNSVFEVDYFEYDQPYIRHLINKKVLLYDYQLDLIGLWHRHPGTFDRFSNVDDFTNSQYAARKSYGAISMLVNLEPEFRLTIYHVVSPCKYNIIDEYDIGDSYFPMEILKYKNKNDLIARINHGGMIKTSNAMLEPAISLEEIVKKIISVLRQKYPCFSKIAVFSFISKSNFTNKLVDTVLTDILYLADKHNIQLETLLKSNKLVIIQKNIKTSIELIFLYSKSENKVLLKYKDELFYYEEGLIKKIMEEGEF